MLSAETHPVKVNPQAFEVMKEVTMDISRHRSKHVAEFQGRQLHYVITVCVTLKHPAQRSLGGDVRLHWSFRTLHIPKVLFLNACGSFGEYAMRLVNRSKRGCKQLISCRSLVQHPCRKCHDHRKGRLCMFGVIHPSQTTDRKADDESTPLGMIGFNPHLSSMPLHKMLDDGKPKARPPQFP